MPSSGMAPVLLALDATCYIADEDNQESIPLADFFVAPRVTVLADRLLVGLALSAEAPTRSCACYRLTRSAEEISLVHVAVALGVRDGEIETARVALGAVSPVPMRANLAEAQLVGQSVAGIKPELIADAAMIAAGECEPRDDHLASAEYRRDMARVLTRRQITRALFDDKAGIDLRGTVA